MGGIKPIYDIPIIDAEHFIYYVAKEKLLLYLYVVQRSNRSSNSRAVPVQQCGVFASAMPIHSQIIVFFLGIMTHNNRLTYNSVCLS